MGAKAEGMRYSGVSIPQGTINTCDLALLRRTLNQFPFRKVQLIQYGYDIGAVSYAVSIPQGTINTHHQFQKDP